ncbi:hypothetical protein BS78_04G050600 [Paspalum vaginatum]|nr:hypothetical protein BS78_04G050600 [Paspalum vaginatum]
MRVRGGTSRGLRRYAAAWPAPVRSIPPPAPVAPWLVPAGDPLASPTTKINEARKGFAGTRGSGSEGRKRILNAAEKQSRASPRRRRADGSKDPAQQRGRSALDEPSELVLPCG